MAAVLPALLVAAFLALSNLELRAIAHSPGHSHAAFTADFAKTWCVPNPSLSYETLQDITTYACNYVDCSAIYSGGPCFDPSNDLSHAAFAMNAYYQEQHDCFGGSGLIAITDPSYGNCYFVGREEMVSSTAAPVKTFKVQMILLYSIWLRYLFAEGCLHSRFYWYH
uniref:glucan endo-1,3-beta-glucosidase 1-like n=1 Tax=Fragaria vesca subsp. vesca TaxID=101020 RepID=UPI0005CAAF26|nr:PREDICTED: glucan endo-1,3-beta-glucosidase 1-like [Fragaria vesca subsp. vesca]